MMKIRWKSKEGELLFFIAVLFLFGMLIGYGLFRLSFMTNSEENTIRYYLERLSDSNYSMEKFWFILWRHGKGLAIYFLVSMTWLGVPYTVYIIIKQGCILSFLLFSLQQTEAFWGGIAVIGFYFPQVLFRLPMWLYCFAITYQKRTMIGKLSFVSLQSNPQKNLRIDAKSFIIILILCILASMAEVLFGSKLMRFMLKRLL